MASVTGQLFATGRVCKSETMTWPWGHALSASLVDEFQTPVCGHTAVKHARPPSA